MSHLSQVSFLHPDGHPALTDFYRLGIKGSFFCGQECFKAGCESRSCFFLLLGLIRVSEGVSVHSKSVHPLLLIPDPRKRIKSSMRSPHPVKMAFLSRTVCSSPKHGCHRLTFPADGTFNPFPSFGFSGLLRPVYPLSPTRVVPDHIPRPDYAEDGSPTILSRVTSRRTDTEHILSRDSRVRDKAYRPTSSHIESRGAGKDENCV